MSEQVIQILTIDCREWLNENLIREYRLYENGSWFASFCNQIVAVQYAEMTHPISDGWIHKYDWKGAVK